MYSTTYCGYCFLAKRLLRARGIPFDEVDVTRDRAARDRVVAETGHRTVPIIFIDDRFIGGSDELHDLDRAGELEVLRAETPPP
jgi:glutaredoxin 3